MSRKIGQIIARGERRWLVRVYLGRNRETRRRNYHNRTVYGSLGPAHGYGRDLSGSDQIGADNPAKSSSVLVGRGWILADPCDNVSL
jgi:hypothetical protein